MRTLLKRLLAQLIDNIDAGTCEMTEDEALEAIRFVGAIADKGKRLSKYQACQQLGVSRASFDNYVRLGLIPRGTKTQGFKELSWTANEINEAQSAIKKYKNGTQC